MEVFTIKVFFWKIMRKEWYNQILPTEHVSIYLAKKQVLLFWIRTLYATAPPVVYFLSS